MMPIRSPFFCLQSFCLPILAALVFAQPRCALIAIGIFSAVAAAAEIPADHAERMARGRELFHKEVASLLKEHCVQCHGGEKTEGDFDLATREGLLQGERIKPFDAAGSALMKLIRHEEEPLMPDNKPKLPDAAIATIAAWIELGAPYDEPLVAGKQPPRDRSEVTDADRKWWSFQPLTNAAPPAGAAHPVDAFLLKAAQANQLALNPPAEPRNLVRRAFLDLAGLPPQPEEIEAFLADKSPDAWAKLIADLLTAPTFGERWARHWLDVARFAESSGFEHDYDRPNAFHYRDFVIRALNSDMPFDQFAQWQIAGDEFAPGNSMAIMATGFLGAGVFPTQITANEVERTRYDAMDDMLATTSSAFLGLTVGCARCHDHKFDPIPEKDYYRLLASFTTTVRSNIELELEPEKAKALREPWVKTGELITAELTNVEASLRPAFDQWIAGRLDDSTAPMWTLLEPATLKSGAKATFKPLGDGSYLVEGENASKDNYTIIAPASAPRITALRLDALTHPSMKGQGPGRAGNGNFGLGKIELSIVPPTGADMEVKVARAFADHEQNKDHLSIAGALDDDPASGWAVDGQIGKDHAAVFVFDSPLNPAPGSKLMIKLSFSVNAQHNIGRLRFSITGEDDPKLDGDAPPPAVTTAIQHARTGGKLTDADSRTLFDWWKQRDKSWRDANAKLAEHNAKEPSSKTSVLVCAEGYTPLVMHSQGPPFLEETHILKRGDTNQKRSVAQQSFLQVLMRGADEKRWAWTPPPGAQYTGRRRSLATWLTDTEHGAGALMARVAVNRIWQHHFGRGLVATPNDFGKTGAEPSNAELLDWLAGELIRNGWHTKAIHQLVMTSAAYQQSSGADAVKLAADPDNTLWMRRIPQRLEAEAVRDSALAVSGALDPTMFGKGSLDELSKRRSIYFTIKRSRLVNSMVAFDAPEPLTSQGFRPTTTVAPQALLLMNSVQTREWALAFAKRVEGDVKEDDVKSAGDDLAAHISRAYVLALGRRPQEREADIALTFIRNGIAAYSGAEKQAPRTLALTDFCQTLLALNEFIYVD